MIKAMGLNHFEFLKQYKGNTNELIGDRAELDDLVVLIKKFLSGNKHQWKGESNELLSLLEKTAVNNRLPFEKFTANTLSRKLNTMQTSLQAAGIEYERGRNGKRYISLVQKCDNNVAKLTCMI